jgi:DNA-binding LacI/PurR family transcriptional regulator
MIAIGVLKGLQQAGIRVPDEVSVAGFDNIIFSAYTNPPLTTFDQPKHFIGSEAARLLLELLDSSNGAGLADQPNVRVLKGRLLVRQSTAAVLR